MRNKELNKADLSAMLLGLRDHGMKRNEIIEILEHVIHHRSWNSDNELIEEADRWFGDLYKIAKNNYDNDGYDDSEPISEDSSDNNEIKIINNSRCNDCGDAFDKGIKFDDKRYCPECALDDELIDYDFRDKLIFG